MTSTCSGLVARSNAMQDIKPLTTLKIRDICKPLTKPTGDFAPNGPRRLLHRFAGDVIMALGQRTQNVLPLCLVCRGFKPMVASCPSDYAG
jgi:hypothetical protein